MKNDIAERDMLIKRFCMSVVWLLSIAVFLSANGNIRLYALSWMLCTIGAWFSGALAAVKYR